jgi:L-ascorbate metabolism protein UlaG (beta-lactamase superfamily)
MTFLRRILFLLLTLGIAGVAGSVWILNDVPDIESWAQRWEMPVAPVASDDERRITARFLGVATLVISDGETTLITDGWFTRVSLWDMLRGTPVSPDLDAIVDGMRRAEIRRAAAVMPVHSHYDHAQDAPDVARRTGAILLGSETTAWIGRGGGIPEEQIRVVQPGVSQRFGDFSVTHIVSKHVTLPAGQGRLGEGLDAPLSPPVPVAAYPEGGAWSILIEHPLGSALVQGSAGFVPGALDGLRADTVFLGMGLLQRQGEAYSREYLAQIVDAVDARRIVPIHFDSLTDRPDERHVPGPRLLDDPNASFELLAEWAEAGPGRSIGWMRPWKPVVLFPGR